MTQNLQMHLVNFCSKQLGFHITYGTMLGDTKTDKGYSTGIIGPQRQ